MSVRFLPFAGAMDAHLRQNLEWAHEVGRAVRNRARSNSRAAMGGGIREARPEQAIVYQVGQDAAGPYADIGYARHHPGFYLWWWEVGTRHHVARPHLRPALVPGVFKS